MFTQNYDDIAEESTDFDPEPKSVKKKPIEEPSLNIEIPRFTHKLFDSKKFGSPSQNKTPNSKIDFRKDDFKTPTTAKILAERKTPFGKLLYLSIFFLFYKHFQREKCVIRIDLFDFQGVHVLNLIAHREHLRRMVSSNHWTVCIQI